MNEDCPFTASGLSAKDVRLGKIKKAIRKRQIGFVPISEKFQNNNFCFIIRRKGLNKKD